MNVNLIMLLIMLDAAAGSGEIIYFADDHYKALGSPDLTASMAGPAFEPGRSGILEIDLANTGRIYELIPSRSEPGTEAAASLERSEELGVLDAFNLSACLSSPCPESIKVLSGAVYLAGLPSGRVQPLSFTIDVDGQAAGMYELLLNISYERQADVAVSDGSIFPLYQPDERSIRIPVEVKGRDRSSRLEGIRSDLLRGKNGTLTIMIRNEGCEDELSARLLAAPPFHTSESPVALGWPGAGQVAVATFEVQVDDNATLDEYSLACEVGCGDRTELLPVTISMGKESIPAWLILTAGLASALVLAVMLRGYWRKRRLY